MPCESMEASRAAQPSVFCTTRMCGISCQACSAMDAQPEAGIYMGGITSKIAGHLVTMVTPPHISCVGLHADRPGDVGLCKEVNLLGLWV